MHTTSNTLFIYQHVNVIVNKANKLFGLGYRTVGLSIPDKVPVQHQKLLLQTPHRTGLGLHSLSMLVREVRVSGGGGGSWFHGRHFWGSTERWYNLRAKSI